MLPAPARLCSTGETTRCSSGETTLVCLYFNAKGCYLSGNQSHRRRVQEKTMARPVLIAVSLSASRAVAADRVHVRREIPASGPFSPQRKSTHRESESSCQCASFATKNSVKQRGDHDSTSTGATVSGVAPRKPRACADGPNQRRGHGQYRCGPPRRHREGG